VPHCIHTTKRCEEGKNCGLWDGTCCSILTNLKTDRIAPPSVTFKDIFRPIVTEKLPEDLLIMLGEFNESED
jgi:hypothetical protein